MRNVTNNDEENFQDSHLKMTEIHYFPVCEVELGFFFSPKVTIYSAHRDTSIAHGYMVRRDLERPGTGVEVE